MTQTWTEEYLKLMAPIQSLTVCVLFKTSAKNVPLYIRQDSLTAHNAYRAKHGVPALKLNDELNDVAQVQQLMRWRHRFTIANNKGGNNMTVKGKANIKYCRNGQIT